MWWTKELNKLRKNTRRKLRVALRQNVPEHWESYREAQRQYRKAVRQAKINNWRNFCESIDKIPEITGWGKSLQKTGEPWRNHYGFQMETWPEHQARPWVYSWKVTSRVQGPIGDLKGLWISQKVVLIAQTGTRRGRW